MIDATSTRYEYLQYHTRYERYAIKDTTAVVLQHETLEYTYTQGGDHNISKFGPSDVLFRTEQSYVLETITYSCSIKQ